MEKIKKKKFFLEKIFWLGILLLLWQITAKSGKLSPILFPPLEDIFGALSQSFYRGNLLWELLFSLQLILQGMLLGILIALILSFLSVKSEVFHSFTRSLTSIMHPIPGIAFLPLVILWIGAGRGAVVFIIIHSVLWPMVINLRSGIDAMNPIYEEVATMMKIKGFSLFREIYFPAALPYTLAGLKIAWSRSWRALISAEMIFGATGGKGGIGWFMFQKRVFMDTAGMLAGLLVIIVVGILVEDVIFEQIENRTLRKWGMSR